MATFFKTQSMLFTRRSLQGPGLPARVNISGNVQKLNILFSVEAGSAVEWQFFTSVVPSSDEIQFVKDFLVQTFDIFLNKNLY